MPDIKDQHDAVLRTIVPRFMIDAVVKGPGFTPHHIAALIPHPEAAIGGHHQRQVADQAAVYVMGMGLRLRDEATSP